MMVNVWQQQKKYQIVNTISHQQCVNNVKLSILLIQKQVNVHEHQKISQIV